MTTFVFSLALLAANLRSWAQADALLPAAGSRRVGGARRLPGAGSGALRRLLRPDADPLLPADRHLGRPGPRRRDDEARDLHARRLAADAGRRGRAGGAHRAATAGSRSTSPTRRSPRRRLGGGTQDWIFLLFAAAFLVKMPAFPLHGWMPDAYREMPIEVLAIFSGVLSKVGAYGFLAIVLPMLPDASVHFQTLMLLIGLASILYGSAMAFTQTNARLIIGYSSVAQLGFITVGIFALSPQGAQGAVLQMVNHGHRRRAAVLHRRAARRARRRLGGHPRHGRHRDARAGARDDLSDRHLRDARDAGIGQLRRRVPDPARALQDQDGLLDHRFHRRASWPAVYMLRDLHPHDAQPRWPRCRLARVALA